MHTLLPVVSRRSPSHELRVDRKWLFLTFVGDVSYVSLGTTVAVIQSSLLMIRTIGLSSSLGLFIRYAPQGAHYHADVINLLP